MSCRVCFTNDSQPGPLLFQDDGYRDQFDVVQNECLSKMVADYNQINQLINQITVICAEFFFFTNDSDEDDQPAHYSGDVGCPAGLQGVAAPCCVDYVLLL